MEAKKIFYPISLTEYSAVTLVQIPTGDIRCTNHKLEHINDVLLVMVDFDLMESFLPSIIVSLQSKFNNILHRTN